MDDAGKDEIKIRMLLGYPACVWLFGSLVAGTATVLRIKRCRASKSHHRGELTHA